MLLTYGLVEVSPAGAWVEGRYKRGELSLEYKVLVPRLPLAPLTAAGTAAHRLQSFFFH